uniref:RRM domain-containing protein n=1 Tax=Aegilops tauschii subsp. strangulata TaxID=200361 RepID=A0A453S1G4_AEGTS
SRFGPVRTASASQLAFETEDGEETPLAFDTEEEEEAPRWPATQAQSDDEDDEQEWAGGNGTAAHGEEEHYGGDPAAEDGSGWTRRQPRPRELFVCNLPRRCGVDELLELFGPYGTVLSVEVRSLAFHAVACLLCCRIHTVIIRYTRCLSSMKKNCTGQLKH